MSTSVTSVTSHFPSPQDGFTTTTSGPVSSGATTVGLNSVAGYANGDIVAMIIDPDDANKKQAFTGTVNTASTQIDSVVWTSGTNQSHASGATVTDYATATHIAMISKGLEVEHDQDGTHSAITATSINNAGSLTQTGVATFTAVPLLPANTIETADLQAGAVTAAKLATAPSRFVVKDPAVTVVNADPGNTNWTGVDMTADTSATATAALLHCSVVGSSRQIYVRKTGGGESQAATTLVAQHVTGTPAGIGTIAVPLDASQSFDWSVDNADATGVTIVLRGYWETVA